MLAGHGHRAGHAKAHHARGEHEGSAGADEPADQSADETDQKKKNDRIHIEINEADHLFRRRACRLLPPDCGPVATWGKAGRPSRADSPPGLVHAIAAMRLRSAPQARRTRGSHRTSAPERALVSVLEFHGGNFFDTTGNILLFMDAALDVDLGGGPAGLALGGGHRGRTPARAPGGLDAEGRPERAGKAAVHVGEQEDRHHRHDGVQGRPWTTTWRWSRNG